MPEETILQLEHDGESNTLRIRRGAVSGVDSVIVDFCKDLPRNQDADVSCLNRHVLNRIAPSTDFICTYSNCSYHHKSESRYILHARSHFVFEVASDALHDTVFRYFKGKFICAKCPRTTSDWISFREHVRHHIFVKPYLCCVCMNAVSSVPELRIHFQKHHVGKQADFVFNGSVYELNTLLTTLLPEASAVRKPLNISVVAPVNATTRISCMSVSGENHPIGLIRHFFTGTHSKDKQKESRVSGKSALENDSSVTKVPGIYEYNSDGTFKCVTCCYGTSNEDVFLRHVWKHIHGSWTSKCAHNTIGIFSGECAVVTGLIEMLKRVNLSRSRKNSICETEANVHGHLPEVLENDGSIVSGRSSKYYFMLLQISVEYIQILFCKKILCSHH